MPRINSIGPYIFTCRKENPRARVREGPPVLTTLAQAENRPVNDPAGASQLVAAQAELQHALDAKTAKQGDTVMARLTESVQIADGTKLPRNTQLIGHIDDVQPAQNKGESKVVLTFDQARLAKRPADCH